MPNPLNICAVLVYVSPLHTTPASWFYRPSDMLIFKLYYILCYVYHCTRLACLYCIFPSLQLANLYFVESVCIASAAPASSAIAGIIIPNAAFSTWDWMDFVIGLSQWRGFNDGEVICFVLSLPMVSSDLLFHLLMFLSSIFHLAYSYAVIYCSKYLEHWIERHGKRYVMSLW